MSVDLLITDMFARFLNDECPPERVRGIERGVDPQALWTSLAELGFPDLTIAEEKGGAEATPETAGEVFLGCGAAALPVPLAFTIWIRGILSQWGVEAPAGRFTLTSLTEENRAIRCSRVPFAATAEWVLAYGDGRAMLLPVERAKVVGTTEGNGNTLRRDLEWSDLSGAIALDRQRDWRVDGALVASALLAGAAGRCLELTVDYANTRVQFGRPIGKFQAIQQQLSVLAEEVFAMRIAAQLAFAGYDGGPASIMRAAMAKGRASEAVRRVAAICHAVVGAIGITDEFDLHLYTRRLYEWRQDFGSEAHWYERVGQGVLDREGSFTHRSALDFVLAHAPAA